MKFYRIRGTTIGDSEAGNDKWTIPGVECPECTGCLQRGYRYPAGDLADVFNQIPNDKKRLSLEETRNLLTQIRARLPYEVPIAPRASFGPHTILWFGSRAEDFIRPAMEKVLLVAEEVLREMLKAKLVLGPLVPTQLHPECEIRKSYFEIQVDEFAEVVPVEEVGLQCSTCGFLIDVSTRAKLVLRTSTIPRSTDLFRGSNCPSVIFASDRFRDFVTSRGYKGLVFQPVGTDVKKPNPEMLREPRNAKPELWPLHQAPSVETQELSKPAPEKTLKRIDPTPALRRKLPKQAAILHKLSKPAIAFVANPLERAEAAVGSSKTRGLPDLPGGFKWPKRSRKPLPFLAQFNLAELAAHDQAKTLPKSGFLWFFYDLEAQPWGFDPNDANGWSVIYADVAAANLKRTKLPKGLEEEWSLPESKLNFGTAQTFPAAASDAVQTLKLSAKETKAYQDCLKQPATADDEESPQHQLLGWPAPLQSADMDGECQLAANGINCGEDVDEDNPKVKALRAGAQDWQLLLQLDSDNDAGLSWGDAGRLYFWIRQQDLAARRFDRCWAILQCH